MVTLEMFQKCIQHIQDTLEKDDKLSELLVDSGTHGWISTAPYLIDDVIDLLADAVGDKCEWIEWFLWEREEGRTDGVYVKQDNGKHIKYTITDSEDLYYLITDDLSNIKKQEYEEPPKNDFEFHQEMSGMDEGTYNNFLNSLFGDKYKESDN